MVSQYGDRSEEMVLKSIVMFSKINRKHQVNSRERCQHEKEKVGGVSNAARHDATCCQQWTACSVSKSLKEEMKPFFTTVSCLI